MTNALLSPLYRKRVDAVMHKVQLFTPCEWKHQYTYKGGWRLAAEPFAIAKQDWGNGLQEEASRNRIKEILSLIHAPG